MRVSPEAWVQFIDCVRFALLGVALRFWWRANPFRRPDVPTCVVRPASTHSVTSTTRATARGAGDRGERCPPRGPYDKHIG